MVGIDVVVWPVVVWNIQIGSGCSPGYASENCFNNVFLFSALGFIQKQLKTRKFNIYASAKRVVVQSGKIQEHPSTEISSDKFVADTKMDPSTFQLVPSSPRFLNLWYLTYFGLAQMGPN